MIIDAFPFYNELDLVEKRIQYLDDSVDFFLICESDHTYMRKQKPLFFQENLERFAAYKNKIILKPYIVDVNAPYVKGWDYEADQRNFLGNFIESNFAKDDVILFSDADEIPNKDRFDEIVEKLKSVDLVTLEQETFFMNLNYREVGLCYRARALKTNILKRANVFDLRFNLGPDNLVQKAGWHLSYFFSLETMIKKVESYSHDEYNNSHFKDPDRIKKCIEQRVFPFAMNHRPLEIPDPSMFTDEFLQHFDSYR